MRQPRAVVVLRQCAEQAPSFCPGGCCLSHQEITDKPPKWSRELLEWRRRQHIMARQRNYTEAEKIRKIADKLESKEKRLMELGQATLFARKEVRCPQGGRWQGWW